MIRKILVALDPDTDTPIATQYAVEVAQRYQASITGLALVDTEHIEAESRGGGIGSMYFAEKLRATLTEETRDKARELLDGFESVVRHAGVDYGEVIKEGVPYQRIVEEMKYHDLLVIGKDPHFFYGHPNQRTKTLVLVVKSIIGPALVVGETHRPINHVVVAYDGSTAAARAVRRFIHLKPFGDELKVELLHIHKKNERAASELILQKEADYMKVHGFNPQIASQQGDDVDKEIVAFVEKAGADLIIAGAHSVSKITKMVFGSTTSSLLEASPTPLFIDT